MSIRDAAVTLGNISAPNGTVQIGVAGDVTGAVTETAATTLTASTLAASTGSTINLGTAGTLTIANLGTVDRGGALTISDSAGGLAVTGDVTGGTTSNPVSISAAGGPLALGTSDIAATNLTLNGIGVTQTVGGGGAVVARRDHGQHRRRLDRLRSPATTSRAAGHADDERRRGGGPRHNASALGRSPSAGRPA